MVPICQHGSLISYSRGNRVLSVLLGRWWFGLACVLGTLKVPAFTLFLQPYHVQEEDLVDFEQERDALSVYGEGFWRNVSTGWDYVVRGLCLTVGRHDGGSCSDIGWRASVWNRLGCYDDPKSEDGGDQSIVYGKYNCLRCLVIWDRIQLRSEESRNAAAKPRFYIRPSTNHDLILSSRQGTKRARSKQTSRIIYRDIFSSKDASSSISEVSAAY